MQRRARLYRRLGAACLLLGVVVGLVGIVSADPEFPSNVNPWLSRKGVGDLAEANEYYTQIGAPATLAAWKTTYFSSLTSNANASYYNASDLGFGREMHCREETAFTACYVVNHGFGAGAPPSVAAEDAANNTRNLPTVAMVYDYGLTLPVTSTKPNDVRFFVYDQAGNLTGQVALDSEGNKFVPYLCLACHGGSYNSGLNQVNQANFLPWDIDSFAYSVQPGYTKAAQLDDFRVLNTYVRNSFPDDKINSLLDGWYGGNLLTTPNLVYDDSYVPPGYTGSADDTFVYEEVVKHYCRGCHMAQAFDLEDVSQLDSAFNAVFVDHDMPHAQLTNHRFWSSIAPNILAGHFIGTGETLQVTKSTDTDDGTCDADCSLREAINVANANSDYNVIIFDAGPVYTLTRNGSEDDTGHQRDLDIRTDMAILGEGANVAIIDGGALGRVFQVLNGATVLIQNVTIRNGSAVTGAGVWVSEGSLTLNFVKVLENHSSAATSTDFAGSGVALQSGAEVEINQSSIMFNTGSGFGGGLLNDGGILAVYNSTVSDNGASAGAGVYTWGNATTTLEHVTLVNNTATGQGGGATYTGDFSLLNLSYNILAGNHGATGPECFIDNPLDTTVASYGYNIFGVNDNAGGCPAEVSDRTPNGPLATFLNVNWQPDAGHSQLLYQPVNGGEAVDAIPVGADCRTPSYDIRNVARPLDAGNNGSFGCDIGAVEVETRPVFLPQLGGP